MRRAAYIDNPAHLQRETVYPSGTGSGYGPPSECRPVGFAPPSPLIVVREGRIKSRRHYGPSA